MGGPTPSTSTTSTTMSKNHYALLGVAPTASETEIRRAYKLLARTFHPDKARRGNTTTAITTMDDHNAENAMFSAIAEAYETLSDEARRLAYDQALGIAPANDARVRDVLRKDAEEAVKLMAVTFDQRRVTELSRSGLVVDDAWYGPRDAVAKPEANKAVVINVTRQLQCLVENSKLVIAKGDSKATSITGLWDPCPGEEKALRVRYFFRGKLHEVTVGDEEMLLAPVKAHLVGATAPAPAPTSPRPSVVLSSSGANARRASSAATSQLAAVPTVVTGRKLPIEASGRRGSAALRWTTHALVLGGVAAVVVSSTNRVPSRDSATAAWRSVVAAIRVRVDVM